MGNKCPFDRVLLMHAVSMEENNKVAIIQVTEHYPGKPGKDHAEVVFSLPDGEEYVRYCGMTSNKNMNTG